MIHTALGDLPQAQDYLNRSLALSLQVGNRSGEAQTLYCLARLESVRADFAAALRRIEPAIALIERTRADVRSQQLRASYFASTQKFYELQIDALMRLHRGHLSEDFDALAVQASERAAASEVGERIIVHEEGGAVEWIPERVGAGRPLRIGERIRLSFESQQAGYLYVINREQYADGRLGDPLLIFPTTRTRNGDNQVAAGRLIEIPAQEDRPNFFTMRRGRMDQTGEQLIALITPQPLTDLKIGAEPLKLTDELVTKWEQAWGAKAAIFERASGDGKAWTRVEREAGADTTRRLTQDDPAPQTIFRVEAGPAEPRLIKLILSYTAPHPPVPDR